MALENFVEIPAASPYLIPVYERFIVDFEKKLNQLSLVQYMVRAAREFTGKNQKKSAQEECIHPKVDATRRSDRKYVSPTRCSSQIRPNRLPSLPPRPRSSRTRPMTCRHISSLRWRLLTGN